MVIWLQQVGMQLLIWLLGLVDSVFAVFGAAAGITQVNANGKEQTLSSYFMNLPGVGKAFWIVIIASVAICGVCTIAAIVKNTVGSKGERKSHVKTIGQSLSTVFITLFMGVVLFVGVGAAETLLRTVNTEMNGGEQQIMSHQIINVSLGESYMYDKDNVLGLNEYDENGSCTYMSYVYRYETEENVPIELSYFLQKLPTPKRYDDGSDYSDCIAFIDPSTSMKFEQPSEIYNQKIDPITKEPITDSDGKPIYEVNTSKLEPVLLQSGWLAEGEEKSLKTNILDESYRTILGTHRGAVVPSGWRYDGKINPDSFNFLIGFLCAIIILIALISATLGLVKRLFDIVLLFIVLPGITATIPLDDGAKFKLWRETVISKVFLAFGSVLAVNIFFIVSPTLWQVTIDASSFVNSLLKVILICGGALTISGGQLLFARLLGTSAEESREMGQSARTLMGGAMTGIGIGKAAGRGLFGYRNANGQRVGGLIKGGAGALGAVGGGAANAIGNAIGGQAYRGSKFAAGVSATQKALKGFGQSSGWIGRDRTTGGNTLGSAVGGKIGALGSRFANSSAAKKSGLNNGIKGAIQAPIDRRHAAAQQSARDMIAAGQKSLGGAYGAAAASEVAKTKALPHDDFGREVLAGFEGDKPSNLPAFLQKPKNDKE